MMCEYYCAASDRFLMRAIAWSSQFFNKVFNDVNIANAINV